MGPGPRSYLRWNGQGRPSWGAACEQPCLRDGRSAPTETWGRARAEAWSGIRMACSTYREKVNLFGAETERGRVIKDEVK